MEMEMLIGVFATFIVIPFMIFLLFGSEIINFAKNTAKPPVGHKAYKTLLRCKNICYEEIYMVRWSFNDGKDIYSLLQDTVTKFDLVLDLYKKQPKLYGILMYKYGDTFNLIEIVLKDAKENDLLRDLELLNKIGDMMDYPVGDFKELKKKLAHVDSLKKQEELEVLYRNLAGEMDILKDLRKFNE